MLVLLVCGLHFLEYFRKKIRPNQHLLATLLLLTQNHVGQTVTYARHFDKVTSPLNTSSFSFEMNSKVFSTNSKASFAVPGLSAKDLAFDLSD